MNALREGFRAVEDNLRALAVYGGISVLASLIFLIVARVVPEELSENPLSIVSLVRMAVTILVGAFVQTLVFSWMSQRMGRPLWKLSTQQSIHEFFSLWLIFQTVEAALWLICTTAFAATGDKELGFTMLLACIPVFALTTPIGACVMHQGNLSKQAVRDAMRVLADLLPQTLVVVMFNSAVSYFVLLLGAVTVVWAVPLVAFIGAYFDILIFGAAWSLASHHERSDDRDDDLDF